MSEQPPIPPLPPDNILPYAQSINQRPTILTVVAILSICIGSLGVLANVCGMFQWVSLISMRSMSIPGGPPVVVSTTTVTGADPTMVEVDDPTSDASAPGAATQPVIQNVTVSSPVFASPFAGMSLWPAVLTSILSVFELALGGYLLFAGIQLLRNVASSRKHHLRYAALKIPITVIASAANAVVMYDMQRAIFSTMPPAAAPLGGSFPLIVAMISAGFTLLLSLSYPVALLIILTRPKIRSYFEEMHPAY